MTNGSMVKRKPKPKCIKHIALVLDKSGSMSSLTNEARSAFNEQIKTIKGQKQKDVAVAVVQFNDLVDPVGFKNAKNVSQLSDSDYVPDGMTAMLDAVGKTIEALECEMCKNDTALVIVISDGMENSSRDYTYESLAEKIKTLQKTKRWTFTYMLANQDLSKVTKALGVPVGNVAAYTASATGLKDMSMQLRGSTMAYMANTQRATDNFYGQKKQRK